MLICSEKQKKYLLENPNETKLFAVLARKKFYKTGERIILHVGDKLFHGKIIEIASVRLMYRYLKYSGLDKTDEWFSCTLKNEKDPALLGHYTLAVLLIEIKNNEKM